MADPLRITVGSSTADADPYAAFDVPQSYYDPVQLDPRSRDLVVRTIFGEAGDKDEAGRAAVANVIRNRVVSGRPHMYGEGVEGVITKKNAFEPWWNATARERMRKLREDDPNYQAIAKIADDIFKGVVQDPTGGATHFYSPSGQEAMRRIDNRRLVPTWAKGQPLANIGGHLFYAPEGAVGGTPSSPAPGRGGAAPVSPSPAPPTIPDDERVQLASLSQAQNAAPQAKAPATDDPYAKFGPDRTPPPAQPTATQKPALPPEMQLPMSGGEAFGVGVKQGVSFGTSDEIEGLDAAFRSLPPGTGAGGLLMATIGLARKAWSDYQADPNDATLAAYRKGVDAARNQLIQARKQQPGMTLLGEVGGGAIVPLPGGPLASVGRTGVQRFGSGVLQGGISGGLSGFGSAEGTIPQRIPQALLGTAGGAAVGGAVTAASPGFMNYIGNAIHGLSGPESAARRYLADLARRASRVPDDQRVLPHQQVPGLTSVVDTLGPQVGGRALRAAANLDDVADAIAKGSVESKAAGQLPRVTNLLEKHFGPLGDNEMARLRMLAEYAQVTSPLYTNVYAQFPSGVMPMRLVNLIDQHPTLKGAAEEALRLVGERAAVQQRRAPGVDSLEFWDQVKKSVQKKIDFSKTEPGTGSSGEQTALKELQRVIINELDNLTGGKQGPYAQARATAEMYFGIDRAISDGQRFMKTNLYTTEMAANDLKGRSPEAQEAFRKAGLSQLLQGMGPGKDSHNLWKNLNTSDDARKKLALLFNNDQKAINEFEAMHHVESIMERVREQVRGNSSTMMQNAAMASLLGTIPTSLLSGPNFDPTTPGGAATWGAVGGSAAALRRGANWRMAEPLARALVSNDQTLIDKAVNAAKGDVRVLNLLRQFAENAFAKSGGGYLGRNISQPTQTGGN